jgi:hypothetical protein
VIFFRKRNVSQNLLFPLEDVGNIIFKVFKSYIYDFIRVIRGRNLSSRRVGEDKKKRRNNGSNPWL